jgi:protein-S-isoprenylcysteine O-methyltransferase Ste14
MEVHTLVVLAACVTWLALGICMRFYFRGGRRQSMAKSWLTLAATLGTLGQIATLFFAEPPSSWVSWITLAGFVPVHLLFWGALATHGGKRPAFAFLPDAPSCLRTTGPYRLIRHPIYSAYLLGWVNTALATGMWWPFLFPGFMAVIYWWAARQEEQSMLSGPMAEQYREYQKRTGMFVPKLAM